MSLTVVDHPTDRPAWIREVLAHLRERLERDRARLLALVDAASDAEVTMGTDDEWGIGQVATHVLISDRGMLTIALRLARGEPAGPTGQPRPAANAVSRAGIASLAAKAATALQRFRAEFPAEPNVDAAAPGPYLGPLNCFGWLLLVAFHDEAHLKALERGGKSAL